MEHRAKGVANKPFVALVVVLAIGGFLGVALATQWVVGESTSAFLGAAGRLDVDEMRTGRTEDQLIGMGAYWALALGYATPVLLCACFVRWHQQPGRPVARAARYAPLVFTAFFMLGVGSFAFDPARFGGHRPLVERYPELSNASADLVLAATWTMLVTAVIALGTIEIERRSVRLVVVAAAFVGSSCLFAVAFS